MNFGSDAVFTQNLNFVNLGLTYVSTTDKLGSVFVPTNIVGWPTNISDYLRPEYNIE